MSEQNQIDLHKASAVALERFRGAPLNDPRILRIERGPDLLTYWRIVRKRRWTILTAFLVVVAIGAAWTLRQKPIYRAKTMVEIEKETPDIVTVQGLYDSERVSDSYLETQYKVLKSEALAERVIDQLGLDQNKEFTAAALWWSANKKKPGSATGPQTFAVEGADSAPDSNAHQNAVELFEERLIVTPIRSSRLVEISFDSQDPVLASRVANALASNFIEQNLEARWESTQKASEWLSRQLLDLKGRLEKSEDDLQIYASTNGLFFIETEKGNNENIVNDRLKQLQEELTKAQAARYEKESLYRLVQSGDHGSSPGVDNKLVGDLTMQLTTLQREYAQLSTTFTPDYPRVKQVQNQIKEVEKALDRERKHAAQEITSDYLAALNREKLVRQEFEAQQKQANGMAEKSVQYNILKREVDTNKDLYNGLLQRLKEAGVSAGLKASNIRIVDPAKPPTKPAKPKVMFNLEIAALLGLGVGLGLALLQDHLDNTLKNPEDVELFLQLPALAFIPTVKSLNGRSRSSGLPLTARRQTIRLGTEKSLPAGALAKSYHRIDRQAQPHSVLAEAFRGLCTSVLLSSANSAPGSMLITSSQPGEGKTTVSTNLAIALAQLGQRVLLVDADLRRPAIHKIFDVRGGSKLVNYLTSQQDWRPMAYPTGVAGLDVLCCGPIPPNPVELLSNERMRTLISEAMKEYKFVVIDSPPLLNVTDSRILASFVEAVILVVKSGVTPRGLVQRAESQLLDMGANVAGVVLNNFDFVDDSYYRYRRYEYYTSRDTASRQS